MRTNYARQTRRIGSRAAVALAAFMSWCLAVAGEHPAQAVAGWLERAKLVPGEVVMQAKLDTGADTSSLHAAAIQHFERDGKPWVAFNVVGRDGRSVRTERPVVRTARVRSALGEGQSRPTVRLGICIGTVYRITEVTLADRSRLDVPLLVGRRFLEGHLLVDSAKRELHEPSCQAMPAP